jgi:type I restriction enzyme S subunit
MGEWKTTSLNQIGRIVTGKTPPTSEQENYGSSVCFVTPTDMDGRRIIDRTLRYLSARGANCVRSSILTEPAVLVSCIGSDMGKAVITNTSCVTNQQINSIIVSNKFDRLFVYYNLSMRRDELRNLAGGAAQPILNKTDFGRLSIDYPPLAEQQKIASILGALDDKIELNRQMNETLEAMARAVFKDWFVDFGPTRAKMEGRRPYLAPEIWSLFPDRQDDEGKPVGWKIFTLEQLAEHCKGSVSPANTPKQIFEHYSLPAFDNGQQPAAVAAHPRRAAC